MLAHAEAYRPPVAVIVNRHARGVSPRLVRRLGRLVGPSDLYLSRSVDDSPRIAGEVLDRGYRAVLLGGGDGTFTQCLTDLATLARREGQSMPSVGVLRLGTGNAIAWALDAGELTDDGLRRSVERAMDPTCHTTLRLLEVDGRLTPFAGVGLDAQIQEDFARVTRGLDHLGIGRRLAAGARYAMAVGAISVPRYVVTPFPEIEVTNLGAPAQRLGAGGRPIGRPVGAGEVLFRGRCSIATGSAIPYFGLGMKMFPFAMQHGNRFQLRCAGASAFETLWNLPKVWRGEYASDSIADFLVERVELRIEKPVPFQIGGDLQPTLRDHVVLSLARPVPVVH